MKLVPLSDIFSVSRGSDLELNALTEQDGGVPFVSRTAENNGVSAHVTKIEEVPTVPANTLSVALGGTPLATFLQKRPYYSGRDVAYLTPLEPMADSELLYYAACMSANRYRYSYGRQANRTLKSLLIPARSEIPAWVTERNEGLLEVLAAEGLPSPSRETLDTRGWRPFQLTELFTIQRGAGPSLAGARDFPGPTPYVTATERDNGVSAWTAAEARHPGNSISVAIDGSVGEAFYQRLPFCANTAVVALVPRFDATVESLLFVATLIRREGKFKYGYGRKWGLARMCTSVLRLPATDDGRPDVPKMTTIIRGLPSAGVTPTLG